MTIKERAMYYYNSFDMNCSEAILHAINDVRGYELTDDAYRLLGAFGAGCGCGSICGAVAAGAAAIGKENTDEKTHGSKTPERAALFIREVRSRYGGETCRDLRKQFYNKTDRCGITVSNIADVLDELWPQLTDK